jgi:hypothetical protein
MESDKNLKGKTDEVSKDHALEVMKAAFPGNASHIDDSTFERYLDDATASENGAKYRGMPTADIPDTRASQDASEDVIGIMMQSNYSKDLAKQAYESSGGNASNFDMAARISVGKMSAKVFESCMSMLNNETWTDGPAALDAAADFCQVDACSAYADAQMATGAMGYDEAMDECAAQMRMSQFRREAVSSSPETPTSSVFAAEIADLSNNKGEKTYDERAPSNAMEFKLTGAEEDRNITADTLQQAGDELAKTLDASSCTVGDASPSMGNTYVTVMARCDYPDVDEADAVLANKTAMTEAIDKIDTTLMPGSRRRRLAGSSFRSRRRLNSGASGSSTSMTSNNANPNPESVPSPSTSTGGGDEPVSPEPKSRAPSSDTGGSTTGEGETSMASPRAVGRATAAAAITLAFAVAVLA